MNEPDSVTSMYTSLVVEDSGIFAEEDKSVENYLFTPSQFAQEIAEQREEAAREAWTAATCGWARDCDYLPELEDEDEKLFRDYWQSQKSNAESASGKLADFESAIPGSNPGSASEAQKQKKGEK